MSTTRQRVILIEPLAGASCWRMLLGMAILNLYVGIYDSILVVQRPFSRQTSCSETVAHPFRLGLLAARHRRDRVVQPRPGTGFRFTRPRSLFLGSSCCEERNAMTRFV